MRQSGLGRQRTQEIIKEIFLESARKNGLRFDPRAISLQREVSTLTSELYYIQFSRGEKQTPLLLVLKISNHDHFYVGCHEVDFYEKVASQTKGMFLPECWLAKVDKSNNINYILLEDLSKSHYKSNEFLPLQVRFANKAIKSLANFHAQWWGNQILSIKTYLLDFTRVRPSISETKRVFPKFADFLGDRLSNKHRKYFEHILVNWPPKFLVERVSNRNNITIVHGDFWQGNILFSINKDPSDAPRIIDWQYWHVNLGPYDLASLIAKKWSRERRSLYEKDLVKRYFQYLIAAGVSNYQWEDCWEDYRVSVIQNALWPMSIYKMHAHETHRWFPILENVLLAYEDLGCSEFLI